MSWKIEVQLDSDQADVGTITATWTDPILGEFSFSKRVKANAAGATAFVSAAVAARDVWQVKQQAGLDGASWILGKINTADPKAGG